MSWNDDWALKALHRLDTEALHRLDTEALHRIDNEAFLHQLDRDMLHSLDKTLAEARDFLGLPPIANQQRVLDELDAQRIRFALGLELPNAEKVPWGELCSAAALVDAEEQDDIYKAAALARALK